MFYTIGMKANSSERKSSPWQKTPVANLIRHVQSGNYYARIRVRGKLIWKSLKTDRISVAKLRLGDFHKEERQRASAQAASTRSPFDEHGAEGYVFRRTAISQCFTAFTKS